MKAQLRFLFWGMFGLLVVGLTSCSDDKVASNAGEDEIINLTDNFGGYKATNEQPAFGDPDIAGLEGSDEADDPMGHHSDVDSLMHLPDVDVYSVEFLWGHLETDSTEAVTTDWSGSLTRRTRCHHSCALDSLRSRRLHRPSARFKDSSGVRKQDPPQF